MIGIPNVEVKFLTIPAYDRYSLKRRDGEDVR